MADRNLLRSGTVNEKNKMTKGNRRALARSAPALLLAVLIGVSVEAATAAADQSEPVTAPSPGTAMTAKNAPFVKESLHQMTATVDALSLEKREVTLRGQDGVVQTIKVAPEARNLAQVKVGDEVTVSYYESFTAQMRKHDKPNEGFQTAAGAIAAAPGERPGGAAAHSIASTVTIDSIDLPGSKVTVRRADGEVATLPIRSDEGRTFVGTLKKGDVVDVMYMEAVAVDVSEAKAKSK
jgi:hypothetical protein